MSDSPSKGSGALKRAGYKIVDKIFNRNAKKKGIKSTLQANAIRRLLKRTTGSESISKSPTKKSVKFKGLK